MERMTEQFSQTPNEDPENLTPEQVQMNITDSPHTEEVAEDPTEMITEGAWAGFTRGQRAQIIERSKNPDVPNTLKRFPPLR